VLGVAVGFLINYQNLSLFGKQSVNFLGIPILRNKTADNKELYFCAKK
jgi:hypothetical protein